MREEAADGSTASVAAIPARRLPLRRRHRILGSHLLPTRTELPLRHASPDPFFLHGTADRLVPYRQIKLLNIGFYGSDRVAGGSLQERTLYPQDYALHRRRPYRGRPALRRYLPLLRAPQRTHLIINSLHKLTPSQTEGVTFYKRLSINCVRCSARTGG